MAISSYSWSAVDEFCNRVDDLATLESWWQSSEREPINLYGRRRVGKSWLFRRFAHGKPAVILVAQEETTPARAFQTFADQLETVLGHRPEIDGVGKLFTLLFRLAESEKILVVIDEFPYLLGASKAERRASLSAIQAVMEQERDHSLIKLILTGSAVTEMERLQQPKSPLYGRLRPLDVRPLSFLEATTLLSGAGPTENLVRYAVAGGMPRYLSVLGVRDLRGAVVANVLDRRGGLFNEPLALLQNELRTPATYFSILETLSGGPRTRGDIAAETGMPTTELGFYLDTLQQMRLAESIAPAGSNKSERKTLWRCRDNFIRFWFRFVRPVQAELEAGADADGYYRTFVEPQLLSHTAPVFEGECLHWVRRDYTGQFREVAAWWGAALNVERRAKRRFTEEIDVVALDRKRVVVVAEAKWTRQKLAADVLADLLAYKLPAMEQAGFDISATQIVLASRSGFTKATTDLADRQGNVRLVTAAEVLETHSSVL